MNREHRIWEECEKYVHNSRIQIDSEKPGSLECKGTFLAMCCHDEFLHFKQPLWCQCAGWTGEMNTWSRANEKDRKTGNLRLTQLSLTFMDGQYGQARGWIPNGQLGIWQTCLNMMCSGIKDTGKFLSLKLGWQKPRRVIPISARQVPVLGVHPELSTFLCQSFSQHATSRVLPLSFTLTHTTVIIFPMLFFFLFFLSH